MTSPDPEVLGSGETVRRWRRADILRSLLFSAIGVACFALAVWGIDWQGVWEQLQELAPLWVVAALASSVVNILLKGARWRVILRPEGGLPFLPVTRAMVIGQFLNSVLPLRAGEVARVYFARTLDAVNTGLSVGSIALEKLIDSAALVVLAVLVLSRVPLPDQVRVSGIWTSAILALVLVALVLAVVVAPLRHRLLALGVDLLRWFESLGLPSGARLFLRRQTTGALESLAVYRSRRATAWLALTTVLVWFTAALTNWLVIRALGLDLGWTAALAILVVLMLGATVPGLPGRFGSFQLFTLLATIPFGVSQEQGLALGVVLHLVVFLPIWVMGAIAFLTAGTRVRRDVVTAADRDRVAAG